jgi:hypothetical protein
MGLTLRMVKEFCLECSGGDRKAVFYCVSPSCIWWPYRTGMSPEALRKKYGEKFTDPKQISPHNVSIEDLPMPRPLKPSSDSLKDEAAYARAAKMRQGLEKWKSLRKSTES